MSYDFYIDNMMLPIPPESINVKTGGKNKKMNLINGKEINILKSPTLKEISFQFMIPHTKYPFASGYNSPNANTIIERLNSLKTSKKPFQFILNRKTPKGMPLFYTNIKCSLEDYEIIDDANNGFDQMVSVNLKEYVEYGTVTATIEKDANGNEKIVATSNTRATTNEVPTSFIVGNEFGGDMNILGNIGNITDISNIGTIVNLNDNNDLWDVVKRLTGDELNYQKVLELNDILDPKAILQGTVINL